MGRTRELNPVMELLIRLLIVTAIGAATLPLVQMFRADRAVHDAQTQPEPSLQSTQGAESRR